MHFLKLVLVLFYFMHISYSAEKSCHQISPCACTMSDTNKIVDLSTIGRIGIPRFSSQLYEDRLYFYNPCYPFSLSDQEYAVETGVKPCHDTAVCEVTPGAKNGTLPTQKALGLQNTAYFFVDVVDNLLKVSYSVPQINIGNTTVTLVCDAEVDYQLAIVDMKNASIFNLTAKCACPGENGCSSTSPSKSGLSTGSVLLITFFVILVVYLGVGVLFNFCRGAHGQELLPNAEFWSELPKLIVEGFVFTCSCFGKRNTYADV